MIWKPGNRISQKESKAKIIRVEMSTFHRHQK